MGKEVNESKGFWIRKWRHHFLTYLKPFALNNLLNAVSYNDDYPPIMDENPNINLKTYQYICADMFILNTNSDLRNKREHIFRII